MWRAFFKALFAAVREYLREQRIEADYREALIENARFDAEVRERAAIEATKRRMRDAEAALGDNPSLDAIRELMRARGTDTR